jgi:hypothetical protein
MKRDPSHDTDPTTGIDAVTARIDAAAATTPDDLDPKTARILRALDRPPRPPAPTPELRASSNGGDFVAYSTAAHAPGAPPRSDEERRGQAFADLSTLVRGAPAATTPSGRSTRTITTVPTASRMRARRSLLAVTCGAIVLAVVGASVWGSSAFRTIAARSPAIIAAPAPAAPAATEKKPDERLRPGAIEPASPSPPALAAPPPARSTTAALASATSAPPARAAGHATPPRASMVPRALLPPPSPPAPAGSTPDDLIQHPW